MALISLSEIQRLAELLEERTKLYGEFDLAITEKRFEDAHHLLFSIALTQTVDDSRRDIELQNLRVRLALAEGNIVDFLEAWRTVKKEEINLTEVHSAVMTFDRRNLFRGEFMY